MSSTLDGTDAAPRVGTGAAVAIGNFDGVHVGHRVLVARALADAQAHGLRSVVLTFDRHPATVVRPSSAPRLLTSVEVKLALLEATGVDEVVVLRFDAERAAEPAEDFVRRLLVAELGTRAVVVGSSFRFGHRQGGDVALLERMGVDLGFTVDRVELVVDDVGGGSGVVSSSRIRSLVSRAALAEATELLGRPHEVRGTVVGVAPDHRSAAVSVPAELMIPPAGRYLGEVLVANGAIVDPKAVVFGEGWPVEIVVGGASTAGPETSPVLVAEVSSASDVQLHFVDLGVGLEPPQAGDLVIVSFIAVERR